jgi:hypothetical protein
VSDADFGESAGSSFQGAYGAPARWATVLSPVAPESVVLALSAHRAWQVKPLGSGFILFGSGPLQAVVAEGEVSATETGSRVHIALHRTDPSSVPAAVVGIATLIVAVVAAFAWWVGHRVWWVVATVAGVGIIVTAWQLSRLDQRVSDQERAALIAQVSRHYADASRSLDSS